LLPVGEPERRDVGVHYGDSAELVQAVGERYRTVSAEEKGRMDEFVAVVVRLFVIGGNKLCMTARLRASDDRQDTFLVASRRPTSRCAAR